MKTPVSRHTSVRIARLALGASLLAMLAPGSSAFAQDEAAEEEDEGIIVTATKR